MGQMDAPEMLDGRDNHQQRNCASIDMTDDVSHGPNYVRHVDGFDQLKPYGICVGGWV